MVVKTAKKVIERFVRNADIKKREADGWEVSKDKKRQIHEDVTLMEKT